MLKIQQAQSIRNEKHQSFPDEIFLSHAHRWHNNHPYVVFFRILRFSQIRDIILSPFYCILIRMLDQITCTFINHGRHRTTSLSVAALLAVSAAFTSIYVIYKRAKLPPHALRHIPQVSSFQLVKAQMQLKSIREIAFTTTLPAANETEHGVYLVVSLKSYFWTRYRAMIDLYS